MSEMATSKTCNTKDNSFSGNIMYSSFSAMNFNATTPRDDIISLFYLMISMLNGDRFPGQCTPEVVLSEL